MPSVMNAIDKLRRYVVDLKTKNADGVPFVSEQELFRKFDNHLLHRLLHDLSKQQVASDDEFPPLAPERREYILKNFRIGLAILVVIARERYILRFCEEVSISDDRLPILSKEALLDTIRRIVSETEDRDDAKKFADSFYNEQFIFKPFTFKRGAGGLENLPRGTILPIMRKEKIGSGGWSTVYEAEIHPDYDKLEFKAEGGSRPQHVFAWKQLKQTPGSAQREREETKREVDIQYAIQGRSPGILPLLAAIKHDENYCLIMPRAERSLKEYMEHERQPSTMPEKLDVLKKLMNVVSALHAIHEYDIEDGQPKVEVRDPMTGKIRIVGSHRDLSLHNILWKNGEMLLADFGHARMKQVRPGDDSGFAWAFGNSTYKAPECRKLNPTVGRRGDIWSLACIISELLTFVLGGWEKVEAYGRRRACGSDSDCFHDGDLLKHEVQRWFKELEAASGRLEAVTKILKLLQRMLHQDPNRRPTIRDVEDELKTIFENPGDLSAKPASTWPDSTIDAEHPRWTELDKTAPRTSEDRSARSFYQLPTSADEFTTQWMGTRNSVDVTTPESSIPSIRVFNQDRSKSHRANPSIDAARGVNPISVQHLERALEPSRPIEDPRDGALQALRFYDTVFLIDDSDVSDDKWDIMRAALVNFSDVAMKSDPDGIDVLFVNSEHCDLYGIRDWADALKTFDSVERAERRLILAERIGQILDTYIERQRKQQKAEDTTESSYIKQRYYKSQLNLLVFTASELHDDDNVKGVIARCMRGLNDINARPRSIGIQFVLFFEEHSPNFRSLDDDLTKEIPTTADRDMIDSTVITTAKMLDGQRFKKVLLGGINDNFDRRESDAQRV